jgi:hypothetical protein
LTIQPDTTSGGSHRQNQHAGNVTTATLGNNTADIGNHEGKINCSRRE